MLLQQHTRKHTSQREMSGFLFAFFFFFGSLFVPRLLYYSSQQESFWGDESQCQAKSENESQ